MLEGRRGFHPSSVRRVHAYEAFTSLPRRGKGFLPHSLPRRLVNVAEMSLGAAVGDPKGAEKWEGESSQRCYSLGTFANETPVIQTSH